MLGQDIIEIYYFFPFKRNTIVNSHESKMLRDFLRNSHTTKQQLFTQQ